MSSFHEHTVRTAFCPSHLQMGCNGVYFALPFTKAAIGVWSLQSLTSMVSGNEIGIKLQIDKIVVLEVSFYYCKT